MKSLPGLPTDTEYSVLYALPLISFQIFYPCVLRSDVKGICHIPSPSPEGLATWDARGGTSTVPSVAHPNRITDAPYTVFGAYFHLPVPKLGTILILVSGG